MKKAEERIGELEGGTIEITQSEQQREAHETTTKQSRSLCNCNKRCNTCILRRGRGQA
jgi:hypothetical protein